MKTDIAWHVDAWDDYLYWQKKDKKVSHQINRLIMEMIKHPFEGSGKPKPLKHALSGYWSRRITLDHRLIYKITDSGLCIAQCRYHYES